MGLMKEMDSCPCKWCGEKTFMTGTGLCDNCWELEHRIGANPELARRVLDDLEKVELKNGWLTLRPGPQEGFLEGRPLGLTVNQYKFCELLMKNVGKVVTFKELLLKVWGPAQHDREEKQYVAVCLSELRKKIGFDSVTTLPKRGYTMPHYLDKCPDMVVLTALARKRPEDPINRET